jgi:segregation and condensation protein B
MTSEVLLLELEALFLSVTEPLTVGQILEYLELPKSNRPVILKAIHQLQIFYQTRSMELVEVLVKQTKAYMFKSRHAYNKGVYNYHKLKPKNLSKAALEVLGIIAYKQPITKGRIQWVRQVDCSSAIDQLKTKELISIVGQAKELGNPFLYATTPKFLEIFGLASLNDLPVWNSVDIDYSEYNKLKKLDKYIGQASTDELKTWENLVASENTANTDKVTAIVLEKQSNNKQNTPPETQVALDIAES